ncbi:uncharacterized protein PG998_004970 [Apiospora kogelbergensis]|uniref:uncharacterized protein n=1 Tax=Apiospora kogelbergensis TaxID=1337665 RepID=UPI0031312594
MESMESSFGKETPISGGFHDYDITWNNHFDGSVDRPTPHQPVGGEVESSTDCYWSFDQTSNGLQQPVQRSFGGFDPPAAINPNYEQDDLCQYLDLQESQSQSQSPVIIQGIEPNGHFTAPSGGLDNQAQGLFFTEDGQFDPTTYTHNPAWSQIPIATNGLYTNETESSYDIEQRRALLGILPGAQEHYEPSLAPSPGFGGATLVAGTNWQDPNPNTSGSPNLKKYQCQNSSCLQTFKLPKQLRNHESQMHPDEDTCLFRCKCDKKIFRKDNYLRHVERRREKQRCRDHEDVRSSFTCKCNQKREGLKEHIEHVKSCRFGYGDSGRPKKEKSG